MASPPASPPACLVVLAWVVGFAPGVGAGCFPERQPLPAASAEEKRKDAITAAPGPGRLVGLMPHDSPGAHAARAGRGAQNGWRKPAAKLLDRPAPGPGSTVSVSGEGRPSSHKLPPATIAAAPAPSSAPPHRLRSRMRSLVRATCSWGV